jgi:sodium-dependent dicarboxylate transporter 2/3/5
MGGITKNEIIAAVIVGRHPGIGCFGRHEIHHPRFRAAPQDRRAADIDRSLFRHRLLDINDLEEIPWNIILLFAGAMSIGFCLWQTGAAEWMAVNWLTMFKESTGFVFIMSIAFFVMMMTNFIMNVAAIAISLPVALVIAPYLGVAGEVILFASLVVAGMPFLLLVGAAPNAIAYDSKQFTTGEFFLWGIPASIILMMVTAFAVKVLWPIMGMPITNTGGTNHRCTASFGCICRSFPFNERVFGLARRWYESTGKAFR